MNICFGCLQEINKPGYCSGCIKNLWQNHKIETILPFEKKEYGTIRANLSSKISISGVQDKISLIIEDDNLKPSNQKGEYILKPIPIIDIPEFQDDVPANEHLTMQIAKQIFHINTAENGLIKFASGEIVYITKRFDRIGNQKLIMEDFCQLSNKTSEANGKNYKYDSSYEELGELLRKYCSFYSKEIEKLYKIILFNFVFGNGDAHLKNFSLYRNDTGDYLLTPFYDLLSTSLHFPNETWFALDLFRDFYSESFQEFGFYKKIDFLLLGRAYGITENRMEEIISLFFIHRNKVDKFISRAFLSEFAKIRYREIMNDRLRAISD